MAESLLKLIVVTIFTVVSFCISAGMMASEAPVVDFSSIMSTKSQSPFPSGEVHQQQESITVFSSASDSSSDASCSVSRLHCEGVVPGIFNFNYLQKLVLGTEVESTMINRGGRRCITVSTSAFNRETSSKIVLIGAGVEITDSDASLIFNGLDFISHYLSLLRPSGEVHQQESMSSFAVLEPKLTNLGFLELAAAIPSLSDSAFATWWSNGQMTVIAPSVDDSSIRTSFGDSCSVPLRFREDIVPRILNFKKLLVFGMKFETMNPEIRRCITVTSAAFNTEIINSDEMVFINGDSFYNSLGVVSCLRGDDQDDASEPSDADASEPSDADHGDAEEKPVNGGEDDQIDGGKDGTADENNGDGDGEKGGGKDEDSKEDYEDEENDEEDEDGKDEDQDEENDEEDGDKKIGEEDSDSSSFELCPESRRQLRDERRGIKTPFVPGPFPQYQSENEDEPTPAEEEDPDPVRNQWHPPHPDDLFGDDDVNRPPPERQRRYFPKSQNKRKRD